MDQSQNIEPLLDPKDVKHLFQCSAPYVYKLAASGRLPCIRIPCFNEAGERVKDLVRFKKEDVLAFVEKHYTGVTT